MTLLMTIPTSTLSRRRAALLPRPQDCIVYTTRFNEYHCDDDVCGEVRDARTGALLNDHECRGMIAIGSRRVILLQRELA